MEDNMVILTIMAVLLLLLLITGIAVFITIEMYLEKWNSLFISWNSDLIWNL